MATLITEETVCIQFGLPADVLRAWIEQGLIEPRRVGQEHGFEPEQVRRIWSLVSLQSDLDVNLEGAAIILEMADQIRTLKAALLEASRQLASQRRVEEFRRRVVGEHLGAVEWDIEI